MAADGGSGGGLDHAQMEFVDRRDAGRRLAAQLLPLADERPVVIAVPRGGVPVASEVARALDAPLDILAVRKLGAPGNPEFGVGAITEDGSAVLNTEIARRVGMTQELLKATVDREVQELLNPLPGAVAQPITSAGPARPRELLLDLGGVSLAGELTIPVTRRGLVIFAHGSGSSRLSPRNRAVAETLQTRGFATLVFDLLTEREEHRRELVFDIPLLARRLELVTRWAIAEPETSGLPIGYFGASTGAAAALRAAAAAGPVVRAVVSRGGRPDLAADRLSHVTAPTLLIVGSRDAEVLELNRRAATILRCPHQLAVVDGAGHLFSEPGTLESVGRLASDWFADNLTAAPASLAAAGAGG